MTGPTTENAEAGRGSGPEKGGDQKSDGGDGSGLAGEAFGTGGAKALANRMSWAVVAELANLIVTAVVFKVLLDRLVPADYGDLQAVIGIALIVGPLSSFGAQWILLRRAVVSNDIRADIGRAMSTTLIGTLVAVFALAAAAIAMPSVLPEISRTTIFLILIAQVTAYLLVELAVTAATANADLKLAAQIRSAAAVFRITALLLFAFGPGNTLNAWAWYFAIGNIGAALGAHLMLAWSNGGLPKLGRPPLNEFSSGFPYGVGSTTEGFLEASDRPLLTQYGFRYEDGIYAAGYRIVTLGFVPLMALLRAQERRFFRQGAIGSRSVNTAGLKMSVLGLGVTVPVSLALYFGAPYLDLVINDSYAETESVLKFLAFLPVIKSFQFSFGNALTAAGNQKTRIALTGVAAVGNLLGNIRFIPDGSWRAAAATTLVAEVGLTLAFIAASYYFARRHEDG